MSSHWRLVCKHWVEAEICPKLNIHWRAVMRCQCRRHCFNRSASGMSQGGVPKYGMRHECYKGLKIDCTQWVICLGGGPFGSTSAKYWRVVKTRSVCLSPWLILILVTDTILLLIIAMAEPLIWKLQVGRKGQYPCSYFHHQNHTNMVKRLMSLMSLSSSRQGNSAMCWALSLIHSTTSISGSLVYPLNSTSL